MYVKRTTSVPAAFEKASLNRRDDARDDPRPISICPRSSPITFCW